MAVGRHIQNPIEWSIDQLRHANAALSRAGRRLRPAPADGDATRPAVNRIGAADLRDALHLGLDDFAAFRTDVLFVCLVYPVVGVVLARLAFGYDMLALLFPLASGFALIGPVAAIGLYEMSRRRERGIESTWADAFGAVRSPAFGAIVALSVALLALFVLWIAAADAIYAATMGPLPPASIEQFARDALTTDAGWAMIAIGTAVGFAFALVALAVSVVSFPLLLDRDVTLGTAVRTSVAVVAANPRAMALWGLIVAFGLAIGMLPLFLGLIVVMPVLGHATWHLYRKAVAR